MRFEVVWLQKGVLLLKAVAQRRVAPIIPCEVWKKKFSTSFGVIRMGSCDTFML